MQRCENIRNSAYSDNDTTQCRSRDAWQRLTLTTITTTHGRIGVGGPWKRRIVRFEKNGWIRFDKSGLIRFEKSGMFVFKKTVFSPSKRRFFRFEKSGCFVLWTVGCVRRGAYCFNSNRRVTNVGSTNLTLSKHGELLYTTIIGRGWEYSVVYFPSLVWIQLQHLNYRCDERSKRRSPLPGCLHQLQILLLLITNILFFWINLEPKGTWNGSKKKTVSLKFFLDCSFAFISGSRLSNFAEKVKIFVLWRLVYSIILVCSNMAAVYTWINPWVLRKPPNMCVEKIHRLYMCQSSP